MLDLLFLLVVIVFFALAVAFVRGCGRIAGSADARGAPMRVGDIVLLVLALGVLAYLVWALLAPERLG